MRFGHGMGHAMVTLLENTFALEHLMKAFFALFILAALTVTAHAAVKKEHSVQLCGYDVASGKVDILAEPTEIKDLIRTYKKAGAQRVVVCADKPDPENGE